MTHMEEVRLKQAHKCQHVTMPKGVKCYVDGAWVASN